ncbi:MAG: AMP-binding protein [Lachnospiraceae bacterium]|nr:AMP-binding protein [Candidatus Equihabitans merdae]
MNNMKPRLELNYPEITMYRHIAETASQYPAEPAYEFYNHTTSFKEFLKKIDAAAKAFYAAGVREGDVVTLCLPNIPQCIAAFYAINKIGAVANMIHPLSAQSEITFYLNFAESNYIMTVDMFYEKVKTAVKDVDHDVTVIVTRIQDELALPLKLAYIAAKGRGFLKYPDRAGDILWTRFLAKGASCSEVPEAAFDRSKTSVILYSGGTSGLPKGICLTNYNMNCLAYQCRSQVPYPFGPGHKMLSCMPMFHGFGLGVNIHTALVFGAECILMPTFSPKTYANMLIKKRPNFIAGVPTIYEALLHIPALENHNFDHLQGVFSGGDSLSVELKKKVDDFITSRGSKVQVQEGYGLTECVTASCLTPYDAPKPGSIGLPLPDMIYAIVSPGTDDVLPNGSEGEIILTGPTLMLGYLKNPEETAQTLRTLGDGRTWLYTGDLGYMDDDGYVYFKQRIKRMIITNGYNVYPGQLENVLDGIDEVSYSCVIGVKDPRRGQKVVAYVVLKDGVEDTAELREHIMDVLKENVAGYALPKKLVVRKELPKTLVGKVFYRKLEEEANAEAEQENANG